MVMGALIDRGANGGISGKNARVITTSTRHANVSGIDNHKLNHLPIVTARGVADTQRGEVIVVLNQFAYLPSGKTIILSIQVNLLGIR